MLQFKNTTAFPGTMYVLPDESGIDTAYAVLKATYKLAAQPLVAEEQAPVALMDEYHGDPSKSSLKNASDVALMKPATDVLLQGFAYIPFGRKAGQVDVSLRVSGRVNKQVRVFGDRDWEFTGVTHSVSAPLPFEVMPLTWERAFGGPEIAANPVGCGAQRPPNLEDPRRLISSPGDRAAPASFGPVPGHWEPRRSCAGTYDAAWQSNRAPYLPADFNPWFFQLAPRDQSAPGYLQGGEPVWLNGCAREGQLSFYLPRHVVKFGFQMDDRLHIQTANLDTVTIDTETMLLKLVWRASLRCDKKALRIREVEVKVS